MRRPDRHKNEGTTLLSKIIFDCASKAGIECVVKDIDAMYGIIPRGNMCRLYRYYWAGSQNYAEYCSAYLNDTKLTIDFQPISKSLDSRINPKFWHILVRPDSLDCKYEVDINNPEAFDELVELFVALRPISSRPNNSL